MHLLWLSKGKFAAMVVCWLLGNGCLFSWNSMLTITDYYVALFPVTSVSYLWILVLFCNVIPLMNSSIWFILLLFPLVQTYHPSRVLTLVYQPFALFTLIVLSYHEAKINTRKRNLFGYTLFFLSTLLVLVVGTIVSADIDHCCEWINQPSKPLHSVIFSWI